MQCVTQTSSFGQAEHVANQGAKVTLRKSVSLLFVSALIVAHIVLNISYEGQRLPPACLQLPCSR